MSQPDLHRDPEKTPLGVVGEDETGALRDLSEVRGQPLRFDVGEPVAVSRYTAGDAGLSIFDLGSGLVAARLEVGQRMEIRIRGERGLVTSAIYSLQQLSEAHLLVATMSHLYVLTRVEAAEQLPREVLDQAAQDLAWGTPMPEADADDMTRYSRIGAELADQDASGWSGATVRIDVRRGDSVEELGFATLLEAPATGSGLRFSLSSGGLMASSGVERIRSIADGEIEAETANSSYRITLVEKE